MIDPMTEVMDPALKELYPALKTELSRDFTAFCGRYGGFLDARDAERSIKLFYPSVFDIPLHWRVIDDSETGFVTISVRARLPSGSWVTRQSHVSNVIVDIYGETTAYFDVIRELYVQIRDTLASMPFLMMELGIESWEEIEAFSEWRVDKYDFDPDLWTDGCEQLSNLCEAISLLTAHVQPSPYIAGILFRDSMRGLSNALMWSWTIADDDVVLRGMQLELD